MRDACAGLLHAVAQAGHLLQRLALAAVEAAGQPLHGEVTELREHTATGCGCRACP
jgi:hypothetical protein